MASGARHARKANSIGTIAVAALALALSLSSPPAQAAPNVLPDLIADPPVYPRPPEIAQLGDGRSHLLLRFNGLIHNVGAGPLEIRGSVPQNSAMTVTAQRIYEEDSTYHDDSSRHPPIMYETSDGHDHWHLMGAARFSLWNGAGTAQVAPAAKVGFCLEDGEPVDSFASPTPDYTQTLTQRCREGQPAASNVFQGISAGWQDIYGANLPFQWVDISDVTPGNYRLASQMDPDDYVIESNEANNGPTLAGSTVAVPGYVASPVITSVTRPRTIALGAQQFGSPGPRVFEITSGPRHGKLGLRSGVAFIGPQVLYTPNAGFVGKDAFTFTARDYSSPFPLHAPTATVTVTVKRRGGVAVVSVGKLVSALRFWRHDRFLVVRGRARRSGVLRIVIRKATRALGACRKPVRSGRAFLCRIKLRKGKSLATARARVTLVVNGRPQAVSSVRVPRHLRRR